VCAVLEMRFSAFGECINKNVKKIVLSASMYVHMHLPCAATSCIHRSINVLSLFSHLPGTCKITDVCDFIC
jgi:hypothetical protein